MSLADKANVDRLAKLCRIQLKDSQKEAFDEKLKKILHYMDLLEEVDTEGVAPCTHVLETMANIMDEDLPRDGFDRDEFLNNAPEQVGGMVKVSTVIPFEE